MLNQVNQTPYGIVAGVFNQQEQAEAAIEDLRQLGLTDKEIGVAVPDPGKYRLVETRSTEAIKDVSIGTLVGGSLGSLAGIALFALAPPLAVLGIGGLLIGATAGGTSGAVVGAFSGLSVRVRWDDAEDRWHEIPLGSDEILVVARSGEFADQAYRIMQKHGALRFIDPTQSESEAESEQQRQQKL